MTLLLSLAATAGQTRDPPSPKIGTTPVLYTVPTALDPTFVPRPALAALGRRIFNDPDLSEPKGLSCASCHDPSRGLSSTRVKALGVAEGSRPGHFGTRNVPALRYVRYTPPLYFFSDEPDEDSTPQPRGGLFQDGRVDRVGNLPRVPLFNKSEMNNQDNASVARTLRKADYAMELRAAFGPRSLDVPDQALVVLGEALRAYLESDALSPFTSRFDAFIKGQGTLTPVEMKGLALFRNPLKGNCGSCHAFNPDSTNPLRSMFTDYGYDAVAAPRNTAIPSSTKTKSFDLGLCNTAAGRGWPDPGQWCGYFRTPSLRNVAVRTRYMHNGVFSDLRTVVEFYATRATDPTRWYPGGVLFDDLPTRYRSNVNVSASPWNRRPGAKPGMDAGEIDAVVAFLRTLTDRDLDESSTEIDRAVSRR